MYRTDTMKSLNLLVSEMLKIPRVNVEAPLLKNLAFLINKCLAQNVQGQQKTFQNKQWYLNSYVLKFSYCLVYSKKLS